MSRAKIACSLRQDTEIHTLSYRVTEQENKRLWLFYSCWALEFLFLWEDKSRIKSMQEDNIKVVKCNFDSSEYLYASFDCYKKKLFLLNIFSFQFFLFSKLACLWRLVAECLTKKERLKEWEKRCRSISSLDFIWFDCMH